MPKTKAVLVSVPFGPLNFPSIGLTILRDFAKQRGFAVEIDYLGMDFSKQVGVKFYNAISAGYPSNTDLVGEFLFSTHFYDRKSNAIEEFITEHLSLEDGDTRSTLAKKFGDLVFHTEFLDRYRDAITIIPTWVMKSAQNLANRNADVYGFTSMFQQNLGLLCMARELKKLRPECTVVLGGPNCEYPMGRAIIEEFQFVDFVCSGEGEDAFVSVLEFVESDETSKLHQNIHFRAAHNSCCAITDSATQATNIELLPPPNYDDYFQQLELRTNRNEISPRVLLETSRGCWWGEKSHCTFCGLNGSSMVFRSKSAEKALSEILQLHEKYPSAPISVVDNIIDYKYFRTLLPLLAQKDIDIELFYETKANLTKAQLSTMRAAGISRIQPGIESLSSSVLHVMRKGVKAMQNICLLKWCIEEGVKPEWNFLWGFPDEDPSAYEAMAVLVQHLQHLQPPNASSRIRLDRFSPLYENREQQPIANVRPYNAYYKVYDVPEARLNDLAYYFCFDYVRQSDVNSYTKNLAVQIGKWQSEHSAAYLIYSATPGGALIFDGRRKDRKKVLHFADPVGDILQICEKPTSIRSLIEKLSKNTSSMQIDDLLGELIEYGIILSVDGLLLNTAIELTSAQKYPNSGFSNFIGDLVELDNKTSNDVVTIRFNSRSPAPVEQNTGPSSVEMQSGC